jgi:hypothetical protein
VYVKEEECQEAKVMSEPLLKRPCKECAKISTEGHKEEIIKIESIDIGFDVKEECLSPISTGKTDELNRTVTISVDCLPEKKTEFQK